MRWTIGVLGVCIWVLGLGWSAAEGVTTQRPQRAAGSWYSQPQDKGLTRFLHFSEFSLMRVEWTSSSSPVVPKVHLQPKTKSDLDPLIGCHEVSGLNQPDMGFDQGQCKLSEPTPIPPQWLTWEMGQPPKKFSLLLFGFKWSVEGFFLITAFGN